VIPEFDASSWKLKLKILPEKWRTPNCTKIQSKMHWTTIERELRVFDDTKVGVKLLVDNGIVKIPQEFVIPTKLSSQTLCSGSAHLQSSDSRDWPQRHPRRWSPTQTNHWGNSACFRDMGILRDCEPWDLWRCHEQPIEVKREYYTRDVNKKVRSVSTFDNQAKAVSWKETLFCTMAPEAPNSEELPAAFGLGSYKQNITKISTLV